MADYIVNKTDLTNLLVETHHLIKAHGFDDGTRREDEVPLRLMEAFKLALNEFPNRTLIMVPSHKRDLIILAFQVLEDRMRQFHPPYDSIHVWLIDSATQTQVLSLIANVLQDFGVTP